VACICVSCQAIRDTLEPLVGSPITVTAIVDLMNHIGRCVVSGNVRQTAEIAFGDPLSEEYINLKDYDVNPHRAAYGWTSNNSVFAKLGMDYGPVVDRVLKNGEPGGCKACLTQAACARTQVDVCCPPPPPPPPSPFPLPLPLCALYARVCVAGEHAGVQPHEGRARLQRPPGGWWQPVSRADAGVVRVVLPGGNVSQQSHLV